MELRLPSRAALTEIALWQIWLGASSGTKCSRLLQINQSSERKVERRQGAEQATQNLPEKDEKGQGRTGAARDEAVCSNETPNHQPARPISAEQKEDRREPRLFQDQVDGANPDPFSTPGGGLQLLSPSKRQPTHNIFIASRDYFNIFVALFSNFLSTMVMLNQCPNQFDL